MIDFANVKSIFIPEGEVVVIACGEEVLWQKRKYKTELAYIESTGTQYIDTGLRLNQNSKLELEMSHFDASIQRMVFGSRSSATKNNFSVVFGPVGGIMSIVTDFDDYRNNRLAYAISGGELFKISISKEKLKINDLEQAVSTYQAFTTPGTAYLFNGNGTYPAGYLPAVMRLYYCKVYNSNKLARDFIPVLDWDDVPCMYDRVTDTLFYNQGTGEFLYE